MHQKLKILVEPLLKHRFLIFCFAVYNFISLWRLSQKASVSSIQPLVPHWYDPWSYSNEPTILLLASGLFLLNKKRGDLAAAILSGYIFFQGLYIINFRIGWADWFNSTIQGWCLFLEPGFVLVIWDFQIVFSLIVFSISVFCLFQRKLRPDGF
jgi:hypothetical protein